MKILLTADDCARGGLTHFMQELTDGLMAQGHFVTNLFFGDAGYFDTFAAHTPAVLGDHATLRALIRDTGFDVVHADSCMIDLPKILKASGFRGKLVITRHAWSAPMGWHSKNCDNYVAIHQSSADNLQPCADVTVECVSNGVDTNIFQLSEGPVPIKPIIGWCGRAGDRVKDIARYLRATQYLDASQFDFCVADADDPEKSKGNFNANQFLHVGSWERYSRDELKQFFSKIARSGGCLLFTAKQEGGVPLAMLEAMSCQCPVVAVDAPGTRDLLTDEWKHWLLCVDATNQEVASLVLEMVQSKARTSIGALARQHIIDNFSVQEMVDGYVTIYQAPRRANPIVTNYSDRKRIAENLCEYATNLIASGGRRRDALFAFRAAAHQHPLRLLKPDTAHLVIQCFNASRMAGARYQIENFKNLVQRKNYSYASVCLLRALSLHPFVVTGLFFNTKRTP